MILKQITMTTEENKHKEEVVRATQLWECGDITREQLEYIFPQLAESEDEKIRKALIRFHKSTIDVDGIKGEDIIDWLEKMGEDKEYTFKSIPRLLDMIEPSVKAKFYCQNLIDTLTKEGYNTDAKIIGECLKGMNGEKVAMATMDEKKQSPKFKVGDKVRMKEFESFPHICTVEDIDSDVYYCDFTNFDIDDQDGWELVKEPKFKVGDFIVNDYCMGRVVEITNDAYLLDTGQGIPFSCEHNAHLWSISDAKDGDVLAEDSCIFIIQKLGDNSTAAKTYCTLYNDGDFDDGSILYFDIDSTKPATKEQQKLLFEKMAEEGYEWDAEKKELTHKEVTKKSDKVWSEEDEIIWKNAIEAAVSYFGLPSETVNWLKSIKQRLH